MTCYVEYSERVEKEATTVYPFSLEETAAQVMEAVLESEQCPYDAVVNVLLTDNAQIREYNRQYRETDRETDVLSFPNLEYGKPADFGFAEEEQADCFDPDSGELLLGDIVLSLERRSWIKSRKRYWNRWELRGITDNQKTKGTGMT